MATTSLTSLDFSWFRTHLLTDILPRWLELAPTPSGFFRSTFDRQWRYTGPAEGTLVSQSRLLYTFATGYRLTGDPAYADAVARGAEFLLRHFRDEQHGGWYWSCHETGGVLDDAKDSYGHAFVIFGLAHAADCLGDDALRRAAVETWEVVHGPLTDAHGGLLPKTSRDFSQRLAAHSTQNPMMHLFEALLALGDAEGLGEIHTCARGIADFVLDCRHRCRARARTAPESSGSCGAVQARALQPEVALSCGIPEMYLPDWTPLPTASGGRVDIGHQFEWAYLLSSAVERGFAGSYLDEANALLDFGLRFGYDLANGGIVADAAQEDNRIIRAEKGYWQQCETIRALMHHAALRGRAELWEPCQRTLDYSRRELIDPEFGGWYGGSDLHKGSTWKLDYHITGMCVEGMRLGHI